MYSTWLSRVPLFNTLNFNIKSYHSLPFVIPSLNSLYIRLPALYGQYLINCLHTVYQKVSRLLLLQIFHIFHEYKCMDMSGISIFIFIIIFIFSGGPLLIVPCTADLIVTKIQQFWQLLFHI